MSLPERFERVLREQCHFVEPDQPIDAGASLQSLGVDSLGMVVVTMKLEEEYEVELPTSLLPAPTTTPAELCAAFDRVLSAGRAG